MKDLLCIAILTEGQSLRHYFGDCHGYAIRGNKKNDCVPFIGVGIISVTYVSHNQMERASIKESDYAAYQLCCHKEGGLFDHRPFFFCHILILRYLFISYSYFHSIPDAQSISLKMQSKGVTWLSMIIKWEVLVSHCICQSIGSRPTDSRYAFVFENGLLPKNPL